MMQQPHSDFIADWLSVWCVAFYVDFGSVRIPRNLNVPPSLRMLGIEPQSKLNCEVGNKIKYKYDINNDFLGP